MVRQLTDMDRIAEQIVMTCGIERTLDVGSGEGLLVASLLRRGVDAHGVDVSEVVTARCNRRMPDRFTQGSVLELPFEDGSFQTVASTDCLEHLAPEDVPKALKEIYRVAKRYVFLQIATTNDRDGQRHLTVEGRAWWEAKCFEAGFRKHPAYYKVNSYEALNADGWQITIVLEKIPEHAHKKYPLSALAAERDLHMDMLREVGERSDAHVARYLWAEKYVRQGDRVLDAACGLGYGSYALAELSKASKITGVDGSDYGVDYARENFCPLSPKLDFFAGYLPECLAKYPDAHFDVIVSFETLEHVEHPEALLTEFHRLLSPGGRIVVSVPNDWSDETGEDPNPHHLHVYDWHRLRTELSKHFILENAFAQTASRCKVREKLNQWESRGRSLYPVAWEDESPADCEWWLMTAMKSPLASVQPYLERVFSNIKDSGHPSIQYAKYFENPWLMHAMVNSEYRLKDASALEALATDVTRRFPLGSNDHSAALCVLSYLSLDDVDSDRKISLITNIDNVLGLPNQNPMSLRWRVSLTFVKARLLESIGRLGDALNIYLECAKIDVKSFGVHLSTKTTEAAYRAGLIAYAVRDLTLAKNTWAFGVSIGGSLLEVDLPEVLINPEWPNLFNHGDGAREFALAWDNIARCANGLNLLQSGSAIDYQALENCFQTEYSGVTGDLLHTRRYLAEHNRELVATRETLQERTVRLEHVSDELRSRTEELVATRETLQERTVRLEKSITDLNKLPWFLKKFLGIAV